MHTVLKELVRLLRDTLALDIFDLNYVYASETLMTVSRPYATRPRRGIVTRIAAFLWHFLMSFRNLLRSFQQRQPQPASLLFFASSKNQNASLVPILERMQNACLVGGSPFGKVRAAKQIPLFFAFLLSLAFFPLVCFYLWQSRGYRRETFYFVFDSYWLTFGYYLVARLWLGKLAPRALVLANDHTMPNRVMAQAAREEHIPTFYIQHASVTTKFPPLSFDYALLEGLDALEKYESIAPSRTKVFLIGMPKADRYFRHLNENTTAGSIGICIGIFDPIPRVEQLCERLRHEFPVLPFVLRPHPGDKREEIWINMAQQHGMEFSDSKIELSFDFLQRVDVIIAGNSNILLEAALINVFPICYDFAQTRLDWYGFERNGLVEFILEPAEVCRRIRDLVQRKPAVRAKTSAYCATVGTQYDGRSSELARKLILELSQNQTDLAEWQRISNVRLEAYELIRDYRNGKPN